MIENLNKLFIQKDGLTLTLTALSLPIILLIGVLIIDGGKLYLRHSQIEHLSRQSGQSGLLQLSVLINDQATANYQVLCQVETPPEQCDSSNLFDFLSETEIRDIILNTIHQADIIQNTQIFGVQFDPQKNLTTTNISVTYPYLYAPNDDVVRLVVNITTIPDQLFSQTAPINYQSIAYLPLR